MVLSFLFIDNDSDHWLIDDAVRGVVSRHGDSACRALVSVVICGVLIVPGNGPVLDVRGYDGSGLPTPPTLNY